MNLPNLFDKGETVEILHWDAMPTMQGHSAIILDHRLTGTKRTPTSNLEYSIVTDTNKSFWIPARFLKGGSDGNEKMAS